MPHETRVHKTYSTSTTRFSAVKTGNFTANWDWELSLGLTEH